MDGQGAQLLQQVQSLLAQLEQQEPEPQIKSAIQAASQSLEPLMQTLGQDDAQDMQSGLVTPNGPPPPGAGAPGPEGGGPPPPMDLSALGAAGGEGGPPLSGGESSEGPAGPPPKSFSGAKKAAMANFKQKGHFNPKGAKGEPQKSEKARRKEPAASRKG